MPINFDVRARKPQSLLAQILTVLFSALVLLGAAMFSLVFLAVIAVAGLLLWVWFWWKTRALRAQIEAQMRRQPPFGNAGQPPGAARESGGVIEGESVRVDDAADSKHRLDGRQDS